MLMDCVAGTTDITQAMVFKPVFLSDTRVKFHTPGYPNYLNWRVPVWMAARGTAGTVVDNDPPDYTQYTTSVILPTAADSRKFADAETVDPYERWHRIFRTVTFPLQLGQYPLQKYRTYLIPGGLPGSGSAPHFRLAAVDADDYSQGYRLSCQGQWVASKPGFMESCMMFSFNEYDAAIVRPRIVSETALTFMLCSIGTEMMISQPCEINPFNRFQSHRPVLMYGTVDEFIDGAEQIFTVPKWAVRMMEMAYVSTATQFRVQCSNDGDFMYEAPDTYFLFVGPESEMSDPAHATVTLVLQQPSEAHSGYYLMIGTSKRFVKFTANNNHVILVSDIAEATPFCLMRQPDGSFAFWHCMENNVLASDGTSVVCKEMLDPTELDPTWALMPLPPEDSQRKNKTSEADTPTATAAAAAAAAVTAAAPTDCVVDGFEVVDAKSLSCVRSVRSASKSAAAAAASSSCDSALPGNFAVVLPEPGSGAGSAQVGTSIDDTVFLKSIAAMFAASPQLYSQRGRAWNLSFDNTMASDWLIVTPNSPFTSYSNFQMAIRDDAANDFHLKPHQAGEPIDPTHPAVELESSVTYPGGPRLNLHAGHSRQIYEEMYNIIITATRCVDIMSLIRKDATPSGQFLAAVRNAITYLSHKPAANSVQIRILLGMPLGWVGQYVRPSGTGPYQHIDDVRNELVRDVSPQSNMRVYVGYTTSLASVAWNHAKMIAVDGQRALVGGHNMWDGPYLWENPVLDATMKLSGTAAYDAHQFADWVWTEQVIQQMLPYISSFEMPNRSLGAKFPPTRLFASMYAEPPTGLPSRLSGSGTPVMSVGRMEGEYAGEACSDRALIKILETASTSILISAQAMKDHHLGNWPVEFLTALGQALLRGVAVTIYMSNPDAAGSYMGDPPQAVITQIQKLTHSADVPLHNLSVRSFPPASHWNQPAGTPGCSSHTKIIVADTRVVSIGSQNYYPSAPAKMSEFTYIVESVPLAQHVMSQFFTPLAGWCLPSPTPVIHPGQPFYTVTLLTLRRMQPSGWLWAESQTPDAAYLANSKGTRIAPSNKKYTPLNKFGTMSVHHSWVMGAGSNPATFHVYDWEFWRADDHLGAYTFTVEKLLQSAPDTPHEVAMSMDWNTLAKYNIIFKYTVGWAQTANKSDRS